LKPDGGKKGSYFRRIDDIKKGLQKIDASKLPSGGRFLFLYYGCEKLGKGIVGIHEKWKAEAAYEMTLELSELKSAVKALNLPTTDAELDNLFLSSKNTSARYWRNKIVHDFGPSNVANVLKNSVALNRQMHDFLDGCTPAILKYLKTNY
jgi:hypothetical protein